MNEEIKNFNTENCIEELTCQICFNILNEPVMELPNQHIMCKKCLSLYNKKMKVQNSIICPFCKGDIKKIIEPRFVIQILNCLQMKCKASFQEENCNWEGNAIEYYKHLKNCKIFINQQKEELKVICDKMKIILEKEITPHLKTEHSEIFNKYVKEWIWLESSNEDWKWFWWCNLPWWNNQSCQQCNILWHKYEDEVEVYEKQRIAKLNVLNSE